MKFSHNDALNKSFSLNERANGERDLIAGVKQNISIHSLKKKNTLKAD